MAKKPGRQRDSSKCRFCREDGKDLDYKNIALMQKLTTSQGKLFTRKRSGNCAKCQRRAAIAIKRARFMALMPYTG